MRFTLIINQTKALEWGLNYQQAALFSCLYEIQSWAKFEVIDGKPYYWAAKNKIIEEIPLIFDKPDTLKRHFIALEEAGLIERITVSNKPFICITEKGKEWNQTRPNETQQEVVRNITTSEESCKKSRPSSEKDHGQVVKKITPISVLDKSTSISKRSIVAKNATEPESEENPVLVKSIIDHLNKFTQVKFQAKGQASKLINARLNDGFTLDDFKLVIEHKASEWRRDAKMCQYLRPITLFNVNKFTGYLLAAKAISNGTATHIGDNWIPDDESTDWANNLRLGL